MGVVNNRAKGGAMEFAVDGKERKIVLFIQCSNVVAKGVTVNEFNERLEVSRILAYRVSVLRGMAKGSDKRCY